MPLSEYEQRVLEQMERQLSSDDPKLVNALQGRPTSGLRRWLVVGAGAVVGLTVLVVGAVISNALVGVLGFLIMFGAIVYAFSAPRRTGPVGVVRTDGRVSRPGGDKRSRPFLQRMEERWDRRRDEMGR